MTLFHNPLERRRSSFDWMNVVVYSFVFLFSLFFFYIITGREGNDISIHSVWSANSSFDDPISFIRHVAHPLWHVLMRIINIFTSRIWAATILTATLKTVELFVVHRFFSYTMQVSQRISLAWALVCLTVSSLCIPSYNPTVYLGVGSPNPWHSPTQLFAMLFMFVAIAYTVYLLEQFNQAVKDGKHCDTGLKKPIILGVILFFSLLAKPTFMQAFLPACCLYFLVLWIKNPKQSQFFIRILLCVLPSIVFMIGQYFYYFGQIIIETNTMVVDFSMGKMLTILISSLLMSAFPLSVIILLVRKPLTTLQKVTYLFFIVATLEYMFLGEGGKRAADGNFGWGMMGASLMLWAVSLIDFVNWAKFTTQKTSKEKAKLLALGLLLAWHLFSGIYYLYYYITSGNLI